MLLGGGRQREGRKLFIEMGDGEDELAMGR